MTDDVQDARLLRMNAYEEAIRGLAFRDDVSFDDVLRKALAEDARILDVERVSFWRLRREPDAIFCELLFVRRDEKYEHGVELAGTDYPAYFRALKTGIVIAAHDAHVDPRTSEFSAGYLTPLGIGSMMDTPVFVRGALAGVVCHEHVGPKRSWTFEEQQFAFSIGQVLSLAIEARDRRSAEAALRESVRGLVVAKEAADTANRELLAAVRELEKRDARLTEEARHAHEFQQSILPVLPVLPGIEITATYRPLELVGGDIYDIAVLEPPAASLEPGVAVASRRASTLQLFIADATGHGVAAALTTMFIRSEYEVIKRTGASPSVVLKTLNDRLTHSYGHLGMRFTAACFAFDLVTGKITYASAAHPNAYVVRASGAGELKTGGTFVGLSPDATYDEWAVALAPGDGLYAFTDGITEAFGVGAESFGDGPLAPVLAEAHAAPGDVGERIWAELLTFVSPLVLQDDATMIGFRWSGARPA